MSLKKIFRKKVDGSPKDDHWIPLSDLMTGLMMVFMLIAILYMVQLQQEKKKTLPTPTPTPSPSPVATPTPTPTPTPLPAVVAVATKYADTKRDLYNDLFLEFHNDLPNWRANIDEKSLSIRFEEPDVLFDTGKYVLKPSFKGILDNFFPRYIRIITKPQYSTTIEEVRIEGHTSSKWGGELNPDDAYSKNMELSQSRTRATLSYVLSLPDIQPKKEWLISHFTANGLSSSHIRKNVDGTENPLLSQRVEFKVKANADEIISEMATYSGK
jgi:outer membrane protein OmpA-like peptidoglycan-associated protein